MSVFLSLLVAVAVPTQPVQNTAAPPAPLETADYGPYFVFFGFDSSAVDRDGEAILAQVASDYRESGGARLILTGHTDRSGNAAYNERLAKRRIEAVREKLLGIGVSPDVIATVLDGEGQPLIDTADGVREAQNRRVEIHFE